MKNLLKKDGLVLDSPKVKKATLSEQDSKEDITDKVETEVAPSRNS